MFAVRKLRRLVDFLTAAYSFSRTRLNARETLISGRWPKNGVFAR
jgi:ABC-type maltose transport system permease subunit